MGVKPTAPMNPLQKALNAQHELSWQGMLITNCFSFAAVQCSILRCNKQLQISGLLQSPGQQPCRHTNGSRSIAATYTMRLYEVPWLMTVECRRTGRRSAQTMTPKEGTDGRYTLEIACVVNLQGTQVMGGPGITGREGCSHDISEEGQQAGDEAAEDYAGGSANQADHCVLEAPHGRQNVAKLGVKALKDGLAVHLHPKQAP